MHPLKLTTLLLLTLLTACGVPHEAAHLASANASLPLPQTDQEIRDTLFTQADTWTHFAARLLEREFGGIQGVDPKFTQLVIRTAALARRQRDLIAQGQDDPTLNRETLQKLRGLWQSANTYLNP